MAFDISQVLKSISGSDGIGWVIEVETESGKKFTQRNFLNPARGYLGAINEVRIDFWWWFDTTPAANRGLIRIYNLASESIELFKKGDKIKLRASWQPDKMPPLIINGTITRIDDFIEDEPRVTRGTEIHFMDSPEHILAKITSRWWKPGTLYSTIFRDLQRDLGLPLRVMKPAKDFPVRTGYSVMGNIWYEMQMVAANMESKLHCYNREVYLLPPKEGIPSGFEWSQTTGLYNVQKRVEVSHDGRAKVFWQGHEPADVHATGLLVPILQADSILKITDLPITVQALTKAAGNLMSGKPIIEIGEYRVVNGCHYCNNSHMLTDVYLTRNSGVGIGEFIPSIMTDIKQRFQSIDVIQ